VDHERVNRQTQQWTGALERGRSGADSPDQAGPPPAVPRRREDPDPAGGHPRGEFGELCRREGIHPTVYYTWLKDFMEAGKARMRGDSLRDATTVEVRDLRQENERLTQLVADLSLTNLTLKKSLS
jgi:hypothetical protein